jgi:hypothetical protein
MSEIRATTISNLAGTGPATLTKQSAAKAWSGVSTTSATAGENFNISSLVDNGTGDTTHNFTTAMSSANFVLSTGARHTGGTDGYVNERTATNRAVGSTRTQAMLSSTGAFVDIAYAQVVVMGDLA